MCFNGAATFQSRKGHVLVPRGTTIRSGFNGAATFQSRKGLLVAPGCVRLGEASMGPRPFSRGKDHLDC